MIITEAIVISILIMFMIMWLVLFYTIHDKIGLLENTLTEIDKSQSRIRESMDKTEMDLCEIVGILDEIEDDINELKK